MIPLTAVVIVRQVLVILVENSGMAFSTPLAL